MERSAIRDSRAALHAGYALKFTEEAFQALDDKNKSLPLFRCTDDTDEFSVNDTFAYVRLAHEAHNIKRRRVTQDHSRIISNVRDVLESLRDKVNDKLHALQDASRRPDEVRLLCLSETKAKAWFSRISGHLRLVEAIEPR
jgi:hypothetical protein